MKTFIPLVPILLLFAFTARAGETDFFLKKHDLLRIAEMMFGEYTNQQQAQQDIQKGLEQGDLNKHVSLTK